ncbi:hypothetical protein PUN28_006434 [Cardiocondyla obscurior]|uniref:Uncharacterized protein n=1 Tax=Cardiocondyla obscurior TaxID=286306 RepID=A0AAW2GAL0_9HYME
MSADGGLLAARTKRKSETVTRETERDDKVRNRRHPGGRLVYRIINYACGAKRRARALRAMPGHLVPAYDHSVAFRERNDRLRR